MNKGFTLIELIIVVVIIGILASVVVASFGQARMKQCVNEHSNSYCVKQGYSIKEIKKYRESIEDTEDTNSDSPCEK